MEKGTERQVGGACHYSPSVQASRAEPNEEQVMAHTAFAGQSLSESQGALQQQLTARAHMGGFSWTYHAR